MGKFKIETPENIYIDEFVALRRKMYAFICGDYSKNELKGICKAQSKNLKFEQYKRCLDGEKNQKVCNNYLIRSLNQEMYYQSN